MNFFKQIFIILVIFFQTGNLLSDNSIFSVNNILLEKKGNISNAKLANQAIKIGFSLLTERILLNEDIIKVSDLNLSNIKELVKYYNISKNKEEKDDKVNFSVTFDKDKIHNLFFKKEILYSDVTDKEFFILPIFVNDNEVFIFSNNYFYNNWNKIKNNDLIEFILPLENIEIIQKINKSKNNLLDLNLDSLFEEYLDKNVAIVLIENFSSENGKIYLKAKIQNKIISKSIRFKKESFDKISYGEKIISEIKDEILNLVKSQNLIDIRTPSFLNAKLKLSKHSNLVEFNSKIKKIGLVENIFVEELNKDYVNFKIKYFGKLEKLIFELKNKNINLNFINEEWLIKTL